MNKKIVCGSIFVIILLLVMPSIPAVQQKIIKDKVYNDVVEKLKDVDVDNLQKQIKKINPKFKEYLKKSDFLSRFESNNDIKEYFKVLIVFVVGLFFYLMSCLTDFIYILLTELQILPLIAYIFLLAACLFNQLFFLAYVYLVIIWRWS